MFKSKTPITVVPPGYKPDLDRLPPQEAGGCLRGFIWVGVLLLVVVAMLAGLYSQIAQPEEALPTVMILSLVPIDGASSVLPTLPPTATATIDYCWFLTPQPDLIPTIFVTPDAWQLSATDTAIKTGTPTPTLLPTQEPPRVWCNEFVDAPGQATPPGNIAIDASPTFTPFELKTKIPTDIELTSTPRPTATARPRATSTLFPTPVPVQQHVQPQTVIVIETVVVIEEKIIEVEKEIIVEKPIEKIKVVTSTPSPTETPTQSPTMTHTITPSPTMVPTATPSPTMVPTATPSPTETPSPTATLIPTSTLFPTLLPTTEMTPNE